MPAFSIFFPVLSAALPNKLLFQFKVRWATHWFSLTLPTSFFHVVIVWYTRLSTPWKPLTFCTLWYTLLFCLIWRFYLTDVVADCLNNWPNYTSKLISKGRLALRQCIPRLFQAKFRGWNRRKYHLSHNTCRRIVLFDTGSSRVNR